MWRASFSFARTKAGDFDALVYGWLGLIDPDKYLGEFMGSKDFRNFSLYSSPQMDALLERGRTELDPAKRLLIYREADRLVAEERFLPALVIAAPMAAVFTRLLRAVLLETLHRDHVRVARSFGFAERTVFLHWVFRNAATPT